MGAVTERLVADYLIAEFQKLGIKLIEDDIAGKIGGNCGNLYGFAEGRGKYADSEPILFCAHVAGRMRKYAESAAC